MKKAFRFAMLTTVFVAVALLALPQSSDDSLDSLKVCAATQKLIFENEFVRVIDDQIPIGLTEAMHRHRHGIVIFLTASTYEAAQDGKKTVIQRKAGTALWSEATVHTVKNAGNAPAHAIRIELKY